MIQLQRIKKMRQLDLRLIRHSLVSIAPETEHAQAHHYLVFMLVYELFDLGQHNYQLWVQIIQRTLRRRRNQLQSLLETQWLCQLRRFFAFWKDALLWHLEQQLVAYGFLGLGLLLLLLLNLQAVQSWLVLLLCGFVIDLLWNLERSKLKDYLCNVSDDAFLFVPQTSLPSAVNLASFSQFSFLNLAILLISSLIQGSSLMEVSFLPFIQNRSSFFRSSLQDCKNSRYFFVP